MNQFKATIFGRVFTLHVRPQYDVLDPGSVRWNIDRLVHKLHQRWMFARDTNQLQLSRDSAVHELRLLCDELRGYVR